MYGRASYVRRGAKPQYDRHRAWRRAPAVKEARGRREPRIVVAPGQGQDAEAGPKAFRDAAGRR